MKKSVFTLLAIATAVFTMSSCSDGGSSNDLNLSQSTQSAQQSQNTSSESNNAKASSFTFQATLTQDILDIYDVEVTRTAAGQAKTYTFNQTTTVSQPVVGLGTSIEFQGIAMDEDVFDTSNNASYKIAASFKLKSNWEDVVKAKGDNKVNLQFAVKKGVTGQTINSVYGSKFVASKLTKESLETQASKMAMLLACSNN